MLSLTLPLFTFRGIPVRLHWSWLLVGAIEVAWRSDAYGHIGWNVAEYVGLFAIVLLHEFGHALACRQVGGEVDQILLWPLGGVARVRPPQRPGAMLWSVAAGPLVNLALVLPTAGLVLAAEALALPKDAVQLATMLAVINVGLFVFNMLPLYPLDGGQVVRSLLWYAVGRARSLQWVAWLGVVGAALGGIAAVVWAQDFWLGVLALYAGSRSWQGIRVGRALATLDALPTHPVARCPDCGQAPPEGAFLRCPSGHPIAPYDSFPPGRCPTCDDRVDEVPCVHCGGQHAPAAALPADASHPETAPVLPE